MYTYIYIILPFIIPFSVVGYIPCTKTLILSDMGLFSSEKGLGKQNKNSSIKIKLVYEAFTNIKPHFQFEVNGTAMLFIMFIGRNMNI